MRFRIIPNALDKKRIDSIDFRIIKAMVTGATNKQISSQLDLPLSTVQRRVRSLLTHKIVNSFFQIGTDSLDLKSGLIHIYLSNGNIHDISKKVYELDGMTKIEFHIGNSDIIGHLIYEDGKELLNIIAAIKKMDGVEKVIWSERIYQSPSKEADVILKFMNNSVSITA